MNQTNPTQATQSQPATVPLSMIAPKDESSVKASAPDDAERIARLESQLKVAMERIDVLEKRPVGVSLAKRLVRHYVTPRGEKRRGFNVREQAETFCRSLDISFDKIQELEVDADGYPLAEEAAVPRRRAVG